MPSSAKRAWFACSTGVMLLGWIVAGRSVMAQQPDVFYRLNARVDDSAGLVRGAGSILYRHHGPVSLAALELALKGDRFRAGAPNWTAKSAAPPSSTGYLRVTGLRLNGEPAQLEYPDHPDSSIARLPFPAPIQAGDSVSIELQWETRVPSLPRHRAREGRTLELSGWYPQVIDGSAASSLPFPAFATFLVTLDLAVDQVIGGTGVPVCGDPGWAGAAATSRTLVTFQRDWYRSNRNSEIEVPSCETPGPGRRALVWYAEQTPEVAYLMSPDLVYEEGDFLERQVRVLYRRGSERSWGAGLAVRRCETAMAWIEELGGRYPWPQLTLVQGLEGRSEAFPMLLVSDVAGQSAVLGQLGLLNTQQILAGGARPFTVGTAAYQTAWFFEVLGRRQDYRTIEREILDWDLDRLGAHEEPLTSVRSPSACATVYCRRTEFLSYQLRNWAGSDPPIRNLYRTLYARFLLKPTVPGAFQQIAGELIRPRPDSLYGQLLRGTLYDDAIVKARREQLADGGWRTLAVIRRRASGLFPETIRVIADSDTAVTRAVALTPAETVSVVTWSRPQRVVLDPEAVSHDWNMLNNQRRFGFTAGWLLLRPGQPSDDYIDTWFTRRSRRDGLTRGWTPTLWFNDVGGWTVGGRIREDYLGRFELNEAWASLSTGAGTTGGRTNLHSRVRVRNPVWLRASGWSETLGVAAEEGRASVDLSFARHFRHRLSDSTQRTLTLGVQGFTVTRPVWVDPGLYDDAGTVELTLTGRLVRPGPPELALQAELLGGQAWGNAGSSIHPTTYARAMVTASTRIPVTASWTAGGRVFAAATASHAPLPLQRRIFLAGADPVDRYSSPFLRTPGAPLLRSGFYYHAPGGAGIRGLDPHLTASNTVAGSLELEYTLHHGRTGSFIERIALGAFGDGALADGDLGRNGEWRVVADAGLGLRIDQHLGATSFESRLDLPLWVSRPGLAQDRDAAAPIGLRWIFSFNPAF